MTNKEKYVVLVRDVNMVKTVNIVKSRSGFFVTFTTLITRLVANVSRASPAASGIFI